MAARVACSSTACARGPSRIPASRDQLRPPCRSRLRPHRTRVLRRRWPVFTLFRRGTRLAARETFEHHPGCAVFGGLIGCTKVTLDFAEQCTAAFVAEWPSTL